MANTIDLYNKRTMLRALEQMKPPRTFLLNTFFNFANPKMHTTDAIDIDMYDAKRRMAEFTDSHMQGKLVEKRGFITKTFKPAYMKPKMITTAEDFLKRQLGEQIIYGSADSALKYANKQVGSDLKELRDMITRKLEWMASKVLQTGTVTISGDGVATREIDFDMKDSHKVTLSGTALWTNAASNPITQVRDWGILVSDDSGEQPMIAVMGKTATNAFINNENTQKQLDILHIELGKMAPRDLGKGVKYIATLEGVEYYTYNALYYNPDTKTNKSMVPDNGFIFGSVDAYTATHFGPIKDLKANSVVPFFAKTWEKDDPSARFLMVQSSPLIAMHQADAFLYATVTA
jgi:hypothetical protein